jgi:hypothetical protein
MKTHLVKLTLFALLIVIFIPLNAQDLEIKIKADTVLVPGGKCVIELNVSGGLAPYTYMLFDNEPWEGGKLLEKTTATNEILHSFTISTAGRYLVAVRDRNELTKIYVVIIKPATSALLLKRTTGIAYREFLM